MKVLVLGDRGSAHATVWKLFNSNRPIELVCAPGNGGTALLVPSAALLARTAAEICHWALNERFNLIVPSDPIFLQAGLADEAQAFRLPIFAAQQRIAQLEQSRLWAKDFLLRNHLPTPPGRPFTEQSLAAKYLAGHQMPVALRGDLPTDYDGAYSDRYSALNALEQIFATPLPPGHLRGVIVEEHLPGPQVALSALCDGQTLVPLQPVRLYQRIGAGEHGTYAPAIGAHASNSPVSATLANHLQQQLLQPLAEALQREGAAPRGLLGIDCVLAAAGPLITNIRCSWSSLEAQVLLPRLADDLLPLIEAALTGRLSSLPPLRWRSQASVALGMVMEGYPQPGGSGVPIAGLADVDSNILVFHSQTNNPGGMLYTPIAGAEARDFISTLATSLSGSLVRSPATIAGVLSSISTSGREVLAVVALGDTLEQARARAYDNASRIHFASCLYRPDIGEHEL